ncbi:MAG: hypothetical protein GC147_13980 [Porphyrobacter sp.]|nr:hypothetical protein [Porphyrobacter sp.]
MLALAADLLLAATALAAVLTLADTGIKARRAYDRLMREKTVLDMAQVSADRPFAVQRPHRTVRRASSAIALRPLPLRVPARAAA